MLAADAMGVADNVVVEHRHDLPAARLRGVRQQLAAPETLLLAGKRGIDDRRGEFLSGEQPGSLHHQRHAGGVVVGAGCIGGGIHHVIDAAVDMPLHDDDAIRIAGAFLHRDHILHADAVGRARAGGGRIDGLDREAIAASAADLGEPPRNPVAGRTNSTCRVRRRGERMARTEAHQPGDRGVERCGIRCGSGRGGNEEQGEKRLFH